MNMFMKVVCTKAATCVLIISLCAFCFVKSEGDKTGYSDTKIDVDAVQLYRRLLKQKREDQLEAVRQIQNFGDYEKQYKLVEMMLQKLFKVIGENRLKLMEAGFVPGDAFPADEHLRDAFSMVAENTAFLGDILLKIPDITHKILNKYPEWNLAIKWSVGFMNESTVYEARENKLLHLMAQELEIIPKDPEYRNPFREEARLDKLADQLMQEENREEKKKSKAKKKKQRGPRLSGGRTEL